MKTLAWQLLFGWLLLCSFHTSSYAVDCPTDTVGLCAPTIEQIIEESQLETIEYEATGFTITTETTTTTTTTTVENIDSGDILDGDNGYVVANKEGDMDIDWGGQGSASMPSGSTCGQLGTDKCAMITGGGNSTSSMGVPNMGTTFINSVDISDLNFDHGGRTNYQIKVYKPDPQDSIYMHITGRDGKTDVFSGTDILSASGVNSQYGQYSGGFDFSGGLTTVIIEVGGRDIGLSVGVMFDDVEVNVLYNVVSTIVEQSITSVEMFVALNTDAPEEVLDVVEDIFDANTPIETDAGLDFEPIEIEDATYDAVEIEIAEIEIEIQEIEIASADLGANQSTDISTVEVEAEIEMEIEMETSAEIENDLESQTEPTSEPEQVEETKTDSEAEESKEETTEESSEESTEKEIKVAEAKKESNQEENQDDAKSSEKKTDEKNESSKTKAVKKILKKIDDKQRYDPSSQIKTLVVMQVLGNTKGFFETQQQLNDRANFFTDMTLPDATISDNNMAGWLLFGGSNQLINEMIDSQWQQK